MPTGEFDIVNSMFLACEKGDFDVVNQILKINLRYCLSKTREGKTPLHIACINNHPKIAQLLITSGAMIEEIDNAGLTSFGCICIKIFELMGTQTEDTDIISSYIDTVKILFPTSLNKYRINYLLEHEYIRSKNLPLTKTIIFDDLIEKARPDLFPKKPACKPETLASTHRETETEFTEHTLDEEDTISTISILGHSDEDSIE